MTILFITHYAGFYGANKSLISVIKGLRDTYHIIPIVLLPQNGPMCNALIDENIEFKVCHYYWWVNYNKGFVQWCINLRKQVVNISCVNRICKLFEKYNVDLVYTNSICVNVGMLVAKKLKKPHVWHIRETFPQFSLKFSLPELLSIFLLKKSVNKQYIVISDYVKKVYSKYLPLNRITRIYNGVNLPQRLSISPHVIRNTINLVVVGVVCRQKNQIDAIRAVSILHNMGIDVHLYIVGLEVEEYKQELDAFVNIHNISNLIHFEQHQNDIFDLLQNMDVGIMPSFDEAFGRVTIEYMLMGLPVIAARSGANAEIIEDGKNGMLYDSFDCNQLATKILMYINNSDLIREHGKYAEHYAKTNFSEELNCAKIYSVIKNLTVK